MRSKEVIETLQLAVQVTLFAMVCIFLFVLTGVSKNMYQTKRNHEVLKKVIETESDKYFFSYSDTIYGTDLIAYIIKYNATHDYYINLKDGENLSITKNRAKELRDAGKDGNVIWTQEYLTNTVFKEHVFSDFLVSTEEKVDGSLDYYIERK